MCVGGETLDLDLFTELIDSLPADLGIAVVVIDHVEGLATRLLEALPGHTRMRVEMITDGLPVRSGKVFIVQRGHDIHVEDGLFRLLPVSKPTGWSNVITIFLRSLIHHWNGQIVAVILSGLDGDGAAALPELKGAGGIIIVQQCDTATNQDMPRSAIQTGCVDFVLPVGNIGAEIARIVTAEAGKS